MTVYDDIRRWAEDRNLIKGATPEAQFQKLLEEMTELYEALRTDGIEDTIDALGDCVVVLIILAAQKGLDLEYCLHQAYDEIKDRKGRMVNGMFVKEEQAAL